MFRSRYALLTVRYAGEDHGAGECNGTLRRCQLYNADTSRSSREHYD
jgi:hypothetical protein